MAISATSLAAPRLLLLLAVVIWGWTFVATKVLLEEIGPVEILALRLAIGTPFLGAIVAAKRVSLRFGREDARPLLAGAAIFTLHFLIQIRGLVETTAINTGWLITLTPLAIAVLSFAFLREPIGRGTAAGIAVATAGVLLLVSRGDLADLGWLRSTGDWLVLASAFTWASYTVATRPLAGRHHPLAVAFAILLLATAFVALPFAATADLAAVRALSPRGLAATLYLAILGLALGQWFWQEGIARLGATRAGLFLYLEPISTVALAVPMLGEPLRLSTLAGGALVLAGVWLGQRERRPEPSESEAERAETGETKKKIQLGKGQESDPRRSGGTRPLGEQPGRRAGLPTRSVQVRTAGIGPVVIVAAHADASAPDDRSTAASSSLPPPPTRPSPSFTESLSPFSVSSFVFVGSDDTDPLV